MQNIKLEVKFRAAAPPSNNHSPSSSLLMPHSLRFNENKAVSDTIAQVNTARDTVLMAPRIKTNLTIYKEGNDILQMKWASKEVRKRHFCTLLKLLDVSTTSDNCERVKQEIYVDIRFKFMGYLLSLKIS